MTQKLHILRLGFQCHMYSLVLTYVKVQMEARLRAVVVLWRFSPWPHSCVCWSVCHWRYGMVVWVCVWVLLAWEIRSLVGCLTIGLRCSYKYVTFQLDDCESGERHSASSEEGWRLCIFFLRNKSGKLQFLM